MAVIEGDRLTALAGGLGRQAVTALAGVPGGAVDRGASGGSALGPAGRALGMSYGAGTVWAEGSRWLRGGRAVAALAVCLVLVLAGCGSSRSSGSSSAAPASSTPSTTSASASTSSASSTATANSGPASPDAGLAGKLGQLPKATASTPTVPAQPTRSAGDRSYLETVFNDAQRFWTQEFSDAHIAYRPARVALFATAVHSGCGAQSDTGPFYCGADHTVYLDLSFFDLLTQQAGVGPFGLAYIVAHELGHHVQNQLGTDQRVALANHQNPTGEKALSVRVELQADCLAGVWASSGYARGKLDRTDLDDALKTATIVGDDFQQTAAGREPDSSLWTHGSSEQRRHWLTTGFDSGRPGACDTFTAGTA